MHLCSVLQHWNYIVRPHNHTLTQNMVWNPFKKEVEGGSFTSSPSKSSLPPGIQEFIQISPQTQQEMEGLWKDLSVSQKFMIGTIGVTAFAIGFKAGRFQNPWRRFASVSDIPSHYFGDTAPFLRGRVLSVSDGDTIRFRHTPSIFFQKSTLQKGEKLSEVTLPIRICTIDTPETAKFGKPSQPFGEEAKNYLNDMIGDKIVHCQLLQADQYGRAVAQVKFGKLPFWQSYVDEKMLQAGLAEVYKGGGAVYGRKGKEAYVEMMERAKSRRRGMWVQGDKHETAAEYKARMKESK